MSYMCGKNKLWLKIIAMVVICLFAWTDIATEASLAFNLPSQMPQDKLSVYLKTQDKDFEGIFDYRVLLAALEGVNTVSDAFRVICTMPDLENHFRANPPHMFDKTVEIRIDIPELKFPDGSICIRCYDRHKSVSTEKTGNIQEIKTFKINDIYVEIIWLGKSGSEKLVSPKAGTAYVEAVDTNADAMKPHDNDVGSTDINSPIPEKTQHDIQKRQPKKIPIITLLVLISAGVGSVIWTAQQVKKLIYKREYLNEIMKPPQPTPGIPMGFFDVESQILPTKFRKAAQKIYNSTARILIYEKKDGKKKVVSWGSGIIVTPEGHIITAYHIIDSCIDNSNHYMVIELPSIQNSVRTFKRYTKIKVISEMCDKDLDIGIVKLEVKETLPYVNIESSEPNIGDRVFVAGHPRGAQRCYVSAGEVLTIFKEPFQFRHNAGSRGGFSGSGVFLVDSQNNPHLVGIATITTGLAVKSSDYLEAFDDWKRMDDISRKMSKEDINKVPSEVRREDLLNTANPNIGMHAYGIATKLSAYAKKDQAKELVSVPVSGAQTAFDRPTFLLTKSLTFTYSKDAEIKRVQQDLISAGPGLATELSKVGIHHIHITAYSSVADDVLSLSYKAKNPTQLAKDLAELEGKRQKLSEHCQTYGFTLDIDEESVETDKLDAVLERVKKEASVIGEALKEVGLEELEISSTNSVSGPTLMVNWEEPNIIQQITNFTEIEKLRQKLNQELKPQGFDVSMVSYDFIDIANLPILFDKIRDGAEDISELLKGHKIKSIRINNYTAVSVFGDHINLDSTSDNPVKSIKDAIAIKDKESRTSLRDGAGSNMTMYETETEDPSEANVAGDKTKEPLCSKATTPLTLLHPLLLFLETLNIDFQETYIPPNKPVVYIIPSDVIHPAHRKWRTLFNNLSEDSSRPEKMYIVNMKGLSSEKRGAKILEKMQYYRAKYENCRIIAAVGNEKEMDLMREHDVSSLIFKDIDLYTILTSLRTLYRVIYGEEAEERNYAFNALKAIYRRLTGNEFNLDNPSTEDIEALYTFLKALIFELPLARRHDYDRELISPPRNIRQLISFA